MWCLPGKRSEDTPVGVVGFADQRALQIPMASGVSHVCVSAVQLAQAFSRMYGQATDKDVCLKHFKPLFSPTLLAGKVAFVTGGGSGICFRISEYLLRHGTAGPRAFSSKCTGLIRGRPRSDACVSLWVNGVARVQSRDHVPQPGPDC